MDIGAVEGASAEALPKQRIRAEAIETDLILDNIFKRLSTKDLKNCRKVCKLWHKAATPVLQKRIGVIYLRKPSDLIWRQPLEKTVKNFVAAAKGAAELERVYGLEAFKFQKFRLDLELFMSLRSCGDWVKHIVWLSLTPNFSSVSTKDFNSCIMGMLLEMPELKHLEVDLGEHYEASLQMAIQLPSTAYEAEFGLESLVLQMTYCRFLDETDSSFLKCCKNLKTLSIDIDGHENRRSCESLQWLEDFKNPEYPREITTLFLKCRLRFCSSEEVGWRNYGPTWTSMFADFVNLFRLQDLRLFITVVFEEKNNWTRSSVTQFDIIPGLLRNIENCSRSIKRLVLEREYPAEEDFNQRSISEVFRALSLPQFLNVEDLDIVVEHREGYYTNGAEHQEQGNFSIPGIKRLSIKPPFYSYSSPQGQVAIFKTLLIAVETMPNLKLLSTGAFSADSFRNVLSIAKNFEGLKELRLNGGQSNDHVGPDALFGKSMAEKALLSDSDAEEEPSIIARRFGVPDSEGENAFRGFLDFLELEKLTLISMSGMTLTLDSFCRGFLKMPRLQKLAISKEALNKVLQYQLGSLDFGHVSFERLDKNDEPHHWDRFVALRSSYDL